MKNGKVEQKSSEITVCVSPQRLLHSLVICVVALLVLDLIGQTARYIFGYGSLKGLIKLFNLDAENAIPAAFSGFLLASCALVLLHISQKVRQAKEPQSLYARHWKGLSIIFLLLSLDELCSMHEQLILPLRHLLHTSGLFYYAWIIPGMIFVAALAAVYARFLRHLEPRVRNRFLLSAIIYVGGAVGVEMIGGWWSEQHSGRNITFALLVAVEETMEMMGATLFLTFLIQHAISLQSSVITAPENALSEIGTENFENMALQSVEEASLEMATASSGG